MKAVQVSHDTISVTFQSQSEPEIEAIRECFGYFRWQEAAPVPTQTWLIVSERVASLDDVADRSRFTRAAPLFKEQGLPKAVIAGVHYYRHAVGSIDCMTGFDVAARTIHFYRTDEIAEHSYIRNLVREPVAAKYKRGGHLLMHASACAIGDRGFVMPGLKGAGKSTLLSHLLAQGARFTANDAVLCKRDRDDRVRLTAYPQCVRLSKETIGANRALQSYFDRPHPHAFIKAKFEFLPSVFDQVFPEHRLTPSTGLAALLIPALDLARTDYAIAPGSWEDALEVLHQSMFYPCHNYVWSPMFDDLNDATLDERAFQDVFGSGLTVYRLNYGILSEASQRLMFGELVGIADRLGADQARTFSRSRLA